MKPLIDEKTREFIRKRRGEAPGNVKELSSIDANGQPDDMVSERMLTPKQIAELLQVNVRTVTKLLEAGDIKGMKVGGQALAGEGIGF